MILLNIIIYNASTLKNSEGYRQRPVHTMRHVIVIMAYDNDTQRYYFCLIQLQANCDIGKCDIFIHIYSITYAKVRVTCDACDMSHRVSP